MVSARQERIDAIRQRQPLAELERKWLKARGRHSNRFWAQEWLDLCAARAAELSAKLRELPWA